MMVLTTQIITVMKAFHEQMIQRGSIGQAGRSFLI